MKKDEFVGLVAPRLPRRAKRLDEPPAALRRGTSMTIAELIVAFGSAGACGAVVAMAAFGLADVGDLLGFVGALVGAFIAVGGAIYVEQRRQTSIELRNAERLAHALQNVRQLLIGVKSYGEVELEGIALLRSTPPSAILKALWRDLFGQGASQLLTAFRRSRPCRLSMSG